MSNLDRLSGMWKRVCETALARNAVLSRAVLLCLFCVNALFSAIRNSGVCDEVAAHIPSGRLYWLSGVFSGGFDNPPLGQLLIALPWRLFQFEHALFSEDNLILFRLPVILMGLVLGNLVYCFGARLYGKAGGLASLLLFAFSPNMLAHGAIATLDMPVTLFAFAATYLLYKYIEEPKPLSIIRLGLALGAAFMVKANALVLAPVVALALFLDRKRLIEAIPGGRIGMWSAILMLLAISCAVVDCCYLYPPFSDGGLLPPQFVSATLGKIGHTEQGHFAYLFGSYSSQGWWCYFPAAIALKTPLPTLVLIGLGLCRKHDRDSVLFVLLPIAAFLVPAMIGRVNIGLRHVLPIYPFLFLLAGAGAVRLGRSKWGGRILAALFFGYLTQAILITPHHLSYFNLLVGGPKHGHKYLIDSNYDWGQNDEYLRRYVASKGVRYKINPDPFRPASGHIFVNANALYGVLNGGPEAYEWLRGKEPVNRIAYTWFEYDIPGEVAPDNPDDQAQVESLLMETVGLKAHVDALGSQSARLVLSRLYAELRAYDKALEELRELLAEYPGYAAALYFGGELKVRQKLGVLRFEDDEYLTGFHTRLPPKDTEVDPDSAVRAAMTLGLGDVLSEAYSAIGIEELSVGRNTQAVSSLLRALDFQPDNQTVREYLKALKAV